MLLDKRDALTALMYGLSKNISEGAAQEFLREGSEMAQRLFELYSSKETDPTPQPDATHDDSATIGPHIAADSSADEFEENSEEAPSSRPRAPFMNFRLYDFHDYTIDFYQSAEVPGYVDSLLAELRRVSWDPRLVQGSSLRGSAFYFTKCPGCRTHVLTNRDLGKHIVCRLCEAEWYAQPIDEPGLQQIVERVSEALGIQAGTGAQLVLALAVQPPAGQHTAEVINEICSAAGMTRLPEDHLLSIHMLQELTQRAVADLQRPHSTWVLFEVSDEAWAKSATPRAISEVVKELQHQVPGVITLSTQLTDEEWKHIDQTMGQVLKDSERALRDRVRAGRIDAATLRQLATVLMQKGEMGEAERKVRAAIAAQEDSAENWHILGNILLREEHWVEAAEALERAITLDPSSALSTLMLSFCYGQLGDEARAREYRARATSLGAPLP
jgi:hypothetical protein